MPEVTLNIKVSVKVSKGQKDPDDWATKYITEALGGKNRVKTIVIYKEDGKVQTNVAPQ